MVGAVDDIDKGPLEVGRGELPWCGFVERDGQELRPDGCGVVEDAVGPRLAPLG